jgi:hypothetical protein
MAFSILAISAWWASRCFVNSSSAAPTGRESSALGAGSAGAPSVQILQLLGHNVFTCSLFSHSLSLFAISSHEYFPVTGLSSHTPSTPAGPHEANNNKAKVAKKQSFPPPRILQNERN